MTRFHLRCWKSLWVTGLGIAVAGVLAAGCDQAGTRTGEGAAAAPAALAGATSARFQATVYEVHIPAAKTGQVDAKALAAQADTPAGLEKALAALGKTKTLYQVDQPVNLARDSINVGTRVPMVTNTRMTEAGTRMNTVQYMQVGALFNLERAAAGAEARKGLDVQLSLEVALLTDTPVEIGPNVKAAAMRNLRTTHRWAVEPGRPVVMFTIDSSSPDENGNPIALVCRIVLSDLKP
jgi:hypothetical protein